MPRTFSLAALLVAITLFCILCGLAVNFPETAFLVALLFSPAIAVMIALSRFSKHPVLLMFNAIVGGVFGFAAYPSFGAIVTESGLGIGGYLAFTAPPTLGVLVAAGGFLLIEMCDRRSQHQ
jgi:hypothetical protein